MKRFAFLFDLKVQIVSGVVLVFIALTLFLLLFPQTDTKSQAEIVTPTVQPTATSVPTATLLPTSTPLPTATPQPTATPLPTATPMPSPTPVPTPTPVPFNNLFNYQPKDVVRQLRPGIIYVDRQIYNPGPMKIHVLLFDLRSSEFDLRVVMKNGYLSGVSRTSDLMKAYGGVAAVNGDLFSGSGLPEGLVISDGQLAMAPKHRATFAWTKDREPFIGYFTDEWTWSSIVTSATGDTHSLQLLNTPCADSWLCIYNSMYRSVKGFNGDYKVLVGPDNIVTEVNDDGKEIKIPEGYNVLLGRRGTEAANWLKTQAQVGERLFIKLSAKQDFNDYQQAVSGGPIILQNGEFVQDCLCNLRDCGQIKEKNQYCEEFPYDWKMTHYLTIRMPRTGIGYNDKKDLLVVAQVDGYQPGFSIGMTQKEFADLLKEFGATTAMELDGGGSSTMALEGGKLVSRPSDGHGLVERMVPNAVLFYWNEAPGASRNSSSR